MKIHILDKFGAWHTHDIDHYDWSEEPKIFLYQWDEAGIITEIIEGQERKRVKAQLIAVYRNIEGFHVEVGNEKQSGQEASGEGAGADREQQKPKAFSKRVSKARKT